MPSLVRRLLVPIAVVFTALALASGGPPSDARAPATWSASAPTGVSETEFREARVQRTPWREGTRRAYAPGRRGRLVVVPGRAQAPASEPTIRYAVEVEGALRTDARRFAATVDRVLNDPRGWRRIERVRFRRVTSVAVRLRIALASPRKTDRLCAPLATRGRFSCASGNRAVLNAFRWRRGAPSYGSDVARYRVYLVNHEVGHVLGRPHASCPGPGRRAPVMLPQTKGLRGCRANPWPLPGE